jgi:type III secretion protein L
MEKMAEFLNLRHFGFDWNQSPHLIKATDVSHVRMAEALIETAKAEADKIREEAARAYDDQYRKGFEAGVADAKHAMAQHIADETAQLETYLETIEIEIRSLVTTTIRKILSDLTDEEKINVLLNAGIQKLRKASSLRVLVAPDQLHRKDDIAKLIEDMAPSIKFVEIAEDEAVEPNHIIIESPLGRIDTSIENEIRLIEHSLFVGSGEKKDGEA